MDTIKVVELFAGVGGFRIGLERASDAFKTIWNNQWEPSTKRQDASLIYQARFGCDGHSNEDINKVKTEDIPDCDLLVGGFPCQDYSVATTLDKSGGINGKKGVLWWQIYRILLEKGDNRPDYLFFENVDRLLSSPAKQKGRDFAIILQSLSDLGYIVEWKVINAADYGMPQRRRRTYILGYKTDKIDIDSMSLWVNETGVIAKAFKHEPKVGTESYFFISSQPFEFLHPSHMQIMSHFLSFFRHCIIQSAHDLSQPFMYGFTVLKPCFCKIRSASSNLSSAVSSYPPIGAEM